MSIDILLQNDKKRTLTHTKFEVRILRTTIDLR